MIDKNTTLNDIIYYAENKEGIEIKIYNLKEISPKRIRYQSIKFRDTIYHLTELRKDSEGFLIEYSFDDTKNTLPIEMREEFAKRIKCADSYIAMDAALNTAKDSLNKVAGEVIKKSCERLKEAFERVFGREADKYEEEPLDKVQEKLLLSGHYITDHHILRWYF